jgi:hypothetical protein
MPTSRQEAVSHKVALLFYPARISTYSGDTEIRSPSPGREVGRDKPTNVRIVRCWHRNTQLNNLLQVRTRLRIGVQLPVIAHSHPEPLSYQLFIDGHNEKTLSIYTPALEKEYLDGFQNVQCDVRKAPVKIVKQNNKWFTALLEELLELPAQFFHRGDYSGRGGLFSSKHLTNRPITDPQYLPQYPDTRR